MAGVLLQDVSRWLLCSHFLPDIRRSLSLKCKSLSAISSNEPPITPDEDSPPLKEKYVHDFRNDRSTRVVYAAGLCSTGAFAKQDLIVQPTAPEQIYNPMMLQKLNTKKINRVAAGFGFSLFSSSTELFGAGLNNFYQIGGPLRTAKNDNKESEQWYIRGRRILLPSEAGKIRDISAGRLHSLIATENLLLSMGDNAHGQCGQDPDRFPEMANTVKNKWTSIEGPWDWNSEKIRSVHCCLDTSFVLLENGQLYSFGLGTDGQLGNGNEQIQWRPQLVEGDLKGERISRISGSTDTLIAVSTAGEVFAWGQNEYGQLGMVSEEPQVFYPQHIPLNIGKAVSAATTGSSCIVCNSDGDVFSWGSMILGFGPKVERLERPMPLDRPLFAAANGEEGKVVRVYAGNLVMAAVTEPGHLFTWGPNAHGNLGIGHTNHQYFPYQVFLPEPLKQASFGPVHSLFLTH